MKAKIDFINGQCVIVVDGKPLSPTAYMSYAPLKENFDAMKKVGVKIFMFPIYAGDEGINMESGLRPFCENFFKGYGEYDFTAVDRALERLFPNGDEDAYVIPRVCLEPPVWWQRFHPDEVARDSRGEEQRESFASKLWLEEMSVAMHALIDHLETSKYQKHIIGYHIAAGGTEEWSYQSRYKPQFNDYSEVNRRAYHKFLTERYGSLDCISRVHGKKYPSLDAIPFPHPIERQYSLSGYLRDPENERAVLDYYDYHNESVANAICYFCHDVKEYTKGERIVGVFYGYVVVMPQNYKGLHALKRVFESPDVDFVSTTNSGKYWHFSSAVEGALMHRKLWMCEGDIRTHLSSGMGKNLAHAMPDNDFYDSDVWHGPADVKGSVDSLTQALARTLTSGVGIWWFDMFGGWFDCPEMLDVIGRSVPLISAPKRELFPTEVALVIDERGHKYSSLDNERVPLATYELLDNLDVAGFPYDVYLLSDICEPDFPADKYRLVIFIAAVNPSKSELDAIREKLKKDEKTLLFLGNSGALSEDLCDFSLKVEPYPKDKRATFGRETYPANPLPVPTLTYNGGYILSHFEDGDAAVVWKKCEGYHSVLSLPLAIPAPLLHHIAHMSGVHLYSRSGDAIFAGYEYVGIRATESGYRRICLPVADLVAEDFLTGEGVTVNDRFVDMWMEKGDMRLLRFRRKE